MRADRTGWIDNARGIGIILVVWGHVLRANLDFAQDDWAARQDHWIYSFHMPLFFLLAGLFLWRGIERGKVQFLKGRWSAIIWPYLLWSTVSGLIELAATRYVNSPIALSDVLETPLYPIEQYWFLYALLVCQIVILCAFPSRLLLIGLTAAGVAIALILGAPWIGVRALLYLPFVVAGVLLAERLKGLSRKQAAILAIVAALLLVLTWLSPLSGYPFLVICGMCGSLAVVGASHLFRSKVLASIGQASLAIYVLHTTFSAGTRIGLKLVGLPPATGLSLALCFLLGLAVPWGIYGEAVRLGWATRLGFGAAGRSARETAPLGPSPREEASGPLPASSQTPTPAKD